MTYRLVSYLLIFFACIVFFDCRQTYSPNILRSNLNYLVVDGILVNGPDSTFISLSRTQNITDSNFSTKAETGANMMLLGEYGENFPLTEESAGKYVVPQLNLNFNETYQLKIITASGSVYLSDTIPVRQTPPIDSVSWKDNDTSVNIYVTTHDPLNKTWYYRWTYGETWQYNAISFSQLVYENGTIVTRTPAQNVYNCWSSDSSTSLLIGTSTGLSSDIIYEQPLVVDTLMVNYYPVNIPLLLPGLNQKFRTEYSIIVYQYAINQAAYNYWYNLKQTTEDLGGLFSSQPSSQVPGNIHNVANPNEPVLGYITASSVQEKRIFINHYDLFRGTAVTPQIGCTEFLVQPDSLYYYLHYTQLYIPLDSVENVFGQFLGIETAASYCADCRTNGGVTTKPPYWPN